MLQEGNFHCLKCGGRSILLGCHFLAPWHTFCHCDFREPHICSNIWNVPNSYLSLRSPAIRNLLCIITVYGAGAERRSGEILQGDARSSLPLKPHLLGSKQTEVCTERCCKDCLFILRGIYWKDTEEPHGRQIQEVYQALWDLGNCQAALLSLPLQGYSVSCLCLFYLLVSPFQRQRPRAVKANLLEESETNSSKLAP